MRCRFALLLLAACNQPPGAPAISLLPLDPSTGDDLVASIDAEASDPDEGDEISYSYRWIQDGAARQDLAGDTVAWSETGKGERWQVQVTPSDGVVEGETAEAEVLILNTPPEAVLSLSPEAPLTDDELLASASATDADGDQVSFAFAWTVDGADAEHADATLPASATSKGERWQVTATPHDGEEEGQPASASVDIANTPPELLSVALDPQQAYEASTLQVLTEAEDADGDEVSLSCAWYVDGTLALEGECSLDGERFDKHQEVYGEAVPHDGHVEGEPMASQALVILNTPPSIDLVTLDPAEIYEASTVSCLPSGWADDDGDEQSYAYSWTVNGVAAGADEIMDGASFDKGDALICTVTPSDGDERGEPLSSDAATVANTPPVIGSVALSDSQPTEGVELQALISGADDDDQDEISYQYEWQVDGVAVSAGVSLTSEFFDKGQQVLVLVTPHDGSEAGEAVSSDTATVLNSPPQVTQVELDPGEPRTDDVITATVSAVDADGDALDLAYAWTVDGVLVSETGSSLDGILYFDKDQQVGLTVTPSDDEEDGDGYAAQAVTVANTAPGAPLISISPTEPVAGEDDLLCQTDVDAQDADGDPISYAFGWTVDGLAYGAGPTDSGDTGGGWLGPSTSAWPDDTVPAEDIQAGELWTCSATPHDGDEDGLSAQAAVFVTQADPLVCLEALLPDLLASWQYQQDLDDVSEDSGWIAYSLEDRWIGAVASAAELSQAQEGSSDSLELALDMSTWLNDSADPFALLLEVMYVYSDSCSAWVDPHGVQAQVTLALELADTGGVTGLAIESSSLSSDYQSSDVDTADCSMDDLEATMNYLGLSIYDLFADALDEGQEEAVEDFVEQLEAAATQGC